MDKLVINGGNRLCGDVFINGSKNAAVAVVPAALAVDGVCVIENLPRIDDIQSYVDTLRKMGVVCTFESEHSLAVDSTNINSFCADYDSVKKIRASYYLLGALLGRFKKAEVALPGGCNFGKRPIDLHIKGFEALGAKIKMEHGYVRAEASHLIGAKINLDQASVGATINIMLAAVHAEGTTFIENAAKEPHVVDTANFLNFMGAKIKGAGTDVIRIQGVEKMRGGAYTIIPDQIEAGTYMIAGAITHGDVTVRGLIPKHMESVSAKLCEIGCVIEEGDDYIRVLADGYLNPANVKTAYYPGFPTDLQPQIAALLCVISGTSIVTETVFDNRFQYVNELKRLGANITVDARKAFIQGGARLTGAEVSATDLRAGASFTLAALAAEGTTTIGNVKYIDRGYEEFESKLASLGADIRRVSE